MTGPVGRYLSTCSAAAHVLLAGEAIGGITWLAYSGSIDGAAAIMAILAALGVGGGGTIASHTLQRPGAMTATIQGQESGGDVSR